MILIADSGSTKCDWVLLDEHGDIIFKANTLGLNPDILTTQKMHRRLADSEEIAHVNDDVKQIYFYGAGCGTEKNKIRLRHFLEKYFRNASVEVHEDILAACLSLTDQPGIVCVLGTGSNACYFDGETARVSAVSLGYIIMDEASGSYYGKQLLRDYFYNKMPLEIKAKFEEENDLSPDVVKHNIYKQENPNAYLGRLARVIFSYEEYPEYARNLVADGLREFIDNWVLSLPESKSVPVHFVGSIAHFSKEIIEEIMKEKGLILGNIQRRPADGLTKYFQNRIKESVEN